MAKIHALNDDMCTFDAFDLNKSDFDMMFFDETDRSSNASKFKMKMQFQITLMLCYAQNESKIEFETYLHYRFPI